MSTIKVTDVVPQGCQLLMRSDIGKNYWLNFIYGAHDRMQQCGTWIRYWHSFKLD
jgi:hypothetical protein